MSSLPPSCPPYSSLALSTPQLLQAVLLRGHRGGQPHRDVGPGHHVHLSVGESSENLLYQDDRCLAGICSSHPILRGVSLFRYVSFLLALFLFHALPSRFSSTQPSTCCV